MLIPNEKDRRFISNLGLIVEAILIVILFFNVLAWGFASLFTPAIIVIALITHLWLRG